tara:strand:+ start:303 stop:461 length:159 start_codon:yes stop_codon:yes gene_type:complete
MPPEQDIFEPQQMNFSDIVKGQLSSSIQRKQNELKSSNSKFKFEVKEEEKVP